MTQTLDAVELTRESSRARLLRLGAEALQIPELLTLLLNARHGEESGAGIAQRIHLDYGARALAERRDPDALAAAADVPLAVAIKLTAILELGRRLYAPSLTDYPVIHSPADVYAYTLEMKRFRQEHFRCLYLNAMNRVVGDRTISIGTINSSIVHPREVYHGAVEFSAHSIILVHNHPSGNLDPSRQDLMVTSQIRDAGRLFAIPVLDHVIISSEGFYSFKDHGKLDTERK